MAQEILTISTGGVFVSSLRYIEQRLAAFKKSGEVTTKIANSSGRSNLTIVFCGLGEGIVMREGARQSETASKIMLALVDAVADIVVTDCKYHYIESSLRLPIEDEISRHAFIRALSGFDRAQDLAIAKSLIKLTPDFLLDSFYTFSLDALKTRWQEVCALANDNACFLICDGTFRELLRFLISNLESRESEVHLFENAGKIEVLTNRFKPINIYVNEELSEDAQVVSKLISIAPKRIFLHQSHCNNQSEEAVPAWTNQTVLNFVQNLFGSCVQVVER